MHGWKVRPGAGGQGRRHDDDDGHQRAARHRDRAHQAEPPAGEAEAETAAETGPVATSRPTALVLNIILVTNDICIWVEILAMPSGSISMQAYPMSAEW